MNTKVGKCGGCLLALGCFTLLAAAPPRRATKEGRMIDALANRNKPPRLVKFRRGRDRDLLPIFPADYDWKEQKRVVAALETVARVRTPEMWEEMLTKVDDDRYCLTVAYHPPNECGEAEDNYSVGYFCRITVIRQLDDVCRRHLPRRASRPIIVDLGADEITDLAAWRRKRKGKALYELQIEVCELYVANLPKVKRKDDDEVTALDVNRAIQRIKAEIRTLKKTKRADLPETDPLFMFELYNSDTAEKCRRMSKRQD
jgi:hypothetical protein